MFVRNFFIQQLIYSSFNNYSLTLPESLNLFNNEYYKQIDGVAMGSPLRPTFASIFLRYYKQIRLKNCPYEFKPVIYKRYVDDTFLLF